MVEQGSSVASVGGVTVVRDNLSSHALKVEKGSLKAGGRVHLSVDRQKRRAVARNHTATHLLQFALRQVLGEHVKQSGSLVERDRLRFDFSHFQGLAAAEIAQVEDIVNEKILDMVEVKTDVKSREEAIREGATALFEEKYGETVRVVSIGDFSRELCGGTHVRNTGETGSFSIVGEGSLAAGVRRIEAVTGMGALTHRRSIEGKARAVARDLKTDLDGLEARVTALLADLDAREKEIRRLKEELIRRHVEEAIKAAAGSDHAAVVSVFLPEGGADDLRKATDLVRDRMKSCVVIAGARDGGKGLLVAAVTKDLAATVHAGEIVKAVTAKYGGKGGGNPQMAQGGVPADRIAEALDYARGLAAK